MNLMADRFHLRPSAPSPATKTCLDNFTNIPAKTRRFPEPHQRTVPAHAS
jgi:hypothetical protein